MARRRNELRDRLESTTARARELTDSRDRANAEATHLRAELDSRRARRDQSAISLLQAATKVFSRAVGENDDLQSTLGRLGVRDVVEQAELLADQVNGLRDDRRLWRSSIMGRWGVAVVAVLVGGLLLLAASAFASEWLTRLLAGGGLVVITAALTSALVAAKRIRSGIQTLARIAHDIRDEQSRQGGTNLHAELDRLRRAEAESQVAQAQLDQILASTPAVDRDLPAWRSRTWNGHRLIMLGCVDSR